MPPTRFSNWCKNFCRHTAKWFVNFHDNAYFIGIAAIRKQLRRYYQQGKYRKSSQYLLTRYQELIGELAAALQRGETWPRARIEQFIADVPLPSDQSNFGSSMATVPHATVAWLKCFLFNLPKTLDGKICCPACGSFDTAPKSKIPQPQVANDPKTGQREVVQTYRSTCSTSRFIRPATMTRSSHS